MYVFQAVLMAWLLWSKIIGHLEFSPRGCLPWLFNLLLCIWVASHYFELPLNIVYLITIGLNSMLILLNDGLRCDFAALRKVLCSFYCFCCLKADQSFEKLWFLLHTRNKFCVKEVIAVVKQILEIRLEIFVRIFEKVSRSLLCFNGDCCVIFSC